MTAPEPETTTNVANDEASPATYAGTRGIVGALARYRIFAYVVGVGLLALVAAMVLDYGFDQPQYTKIVGPAHGFLYVIYLVCTVDLSLKARWKVVRTGLVLLAGMIPFVSFFAERKVTALVSAER